MYNNKERNEEDEMIIPPQLFEIPKKILFLQVPFCEANEKRSKNFLNKFYNFTNEKFKLIIRWKTRNLKSLFPLKDKDLHSACKIYKGICSCESTYVGETNRNVKVRYSEHNHQNIYIRISTMCLPGQLFVLHQKLIEHEKILKRFI